MKKTTSTAIPLVGALVPLTLAGVAMWVVGSMNIAFAVTCAVIVGVILPCVISAVNSSDEAATAHLRSE